MCKILRKFDTSLIHPSQATQVKWIVKFFMTFKCEHPNLLLGPFWKLQVKGNLFICPQIWTVATLTYLTKTCLQIYYFQIFFSENDFSMITPYLFNPISNMFCNFSLKLNMTNCRLVLFFLALWVQNVRDILNRRKTKFALTCSFQKVIWTLTLGGHN